LDLTEYAKGPKREYATEGQNLTDWTFRV